MMLHLPVETASFSGSQRREGDKKKGSLTSCMDWISMYELIVAGQMYESAL
jgi:hypothetical protein